MWIITVIKKNNNEVLTDTGLIKKEIRSAIIHHIMLEVTDYMPGWFLSQVKLYLKYTAYRFKYQYIL